MFMFNKSRWVLGIAVAASLTAQEARLDSRSSVKINLPDDSPVSIISTNLGESRATARGGAMVLDLHMELLLRNTSTQKIRGITLLVVAQEFALGGRGSVAKPCLDIRPGQTFSVPIELRLLRPLQASGGPLVQVSLDGVLFDGFGFYGPNGLNSRRSMTVWETEALRERQHFKAILKAYGPDGLQREMLDSLARQAERPRIDVQVARNGRSTTSAAGPDRLAKFAFLKFPDAPVEPMDGWAEISGSEARAPHFEVLNRSGKAVRYVEIGWLVRDRKGEEFSAASVPATDSDLFLPPGRTGRVLQDTTLKFSRNGGEPVNIQGMTGFISQVEYSDGHVWIPDRTSLENARLMRVLAPTPEEQRLSDLYRKKGLGPLIEELKKF